MENENINLEEEKEYENGFKPKEVHLKENYKFYRRGLFYRIWNKIVVYIFAIIFGFYKLICGYKKIGKKNLKKAKGAMIISNHVHAFDVILFLSSFARHKLIYATTLESNLGFPIVSRLFTGGGAVPIPTKSLTLMRNFKKGTLKTLNDGYPILFFPEGHLVVECKRIRPFMSGAFHYAFDSTKVIIPAVLTFHKPKGIYKILRRHKPCIHYNILEPYYIKDLGTKKITINQAIDDVYKIMNDYYQTNSDYFK